MIILFFLLMVLLFCLLLLCLYTFVFCHPHRMRPDVYNIPSSTLYKSHKNAMLTMVNDMDNTPYTPLTIQTPDGCELYGRLYQNNPQAPVILFFHGYHGTSAWDGYGIYKFCEKHKFNILMADMRAHGQSQGHISFGIKERYDCKLWAEHISRHFGKNSKIILAGVSMGAASILMSSSLNLPANVKGLVCDCSYSEPAAIIKETIKQMRLPVFPFYNLIKLSAHIFGHFDLEEASPLDAVKTLTLPVLFLHGSLDSVVPLSMNDSLFTSCIAPKTRVIIPNADHANSALVNYSMYEDAIWSFVSSLL